MDRRMARRRWAVVAAGVWMAAGPPAVFGQKPDAPPQGAGAKAAALPRWARETEDSIRPLPLESIPDSPPPHEGNLFRIAHRIEPQDLVVIEVLEAFPGRPITGERLVRPDGKVSLQWYGEVEVAGLTSDQVKEKVVLHLREFLTDQALGVIVWREWGKIQDRKKPRPPDPRPHIPLPEFDLPALPENQGGVLHDPFFQYLGPLAASADRSPAAGAPAKIAGIAGRTAEPKPINALDFLRNPPPFAPSPAPVDGPSPEAKPQPNPAADMPVMGGGGDYVYVEARESDRVFVDVSAYNSKVYYVSGDIGRPGRLPYTGLDTVLDALKYSGGLLPMADRHNIRLNRPARGEKPARSYRIDLDAIERGEKKANLQLFPGDRLLIGRQGDPQAPVL